ncbi:XRE family transcriptional regulator [Candidatus Competibacter phosphatis]|uniref:XRE family transcriptional regulator n=1 Tax=Candidatus Competibacter phosphatis TaxID=221280 RepID=A0ABX1THI2_9GAMM|nr:helix-turn-helix transcriptional regulator [Candidatus Competibacter phosphatis]NMQ18833.1 XRE family transcriptional regulator [Candidatus Competibacter phosphatis]
MNKKLKPSATRKHFALNLRKTRERLGLSQEALADAAGLHRTYVGSVERGERNISIDNIERLAAALGVSPASLLAEAKQ